MSDIKFDFARAQDLLGKLNDCSRSFGEMASVLETEINAAGEWWKGESYDAFKAKYKKSVIDALDDKTKEVSGHLGKIAESKKALEKNTANAFK